MYVCYEMLFEFCESVWLSFNDENDDDDDELYGSGDDDDDDGVTDYFSEHA